MLPSSERGNFLDRACGDNRAKRIEILDLLDVFHAAAAHVKEPTFAERVGDDRIGNYQLLEEIGEGGCGTVYLAEQTSPVHREVALKIIKLGMDTKAVINRFEAERQALALMDHPNIARVFDAGATPTGRPYFVMELVRGIKITEYADLCCLSVSERLMLFVQVCNAIHHAHLKGIIHRDIKPSNVLVTLHDGTPVVKVIDFGIAKAMQGRLTDQTLHTLIDQFIGTPAYVSPEQTEPGGHNVDARSDIYSLGVLLYELLTGSPPLGYALDSAKNVDQLRRRIQEEAPQRPSRRLVGLIEQTGSSTSPRYRMNLDTVAAKIRDELDWITMRCLAKDRDERYQSTNELAADVHRYLNSEPVAARPPTLAYTLRKFAQRHRIAFVATSLVVVVLLVATVVSTWQAVRATEAERLAQHTIASLVNVFSAARPL